MVFRYDYSDSVKEMLKHLHKKDKKTYGIVLKKIEEISSRDKITIEYYKNLRNDLSDYKRVHVSKSFVLMFRVFKKEEFILFERLVHHDEAYK